MGTYTEKVPMNKKAAHKQEWRFVASMYDKYGRIIERDTDDGTVFIYTKGGKELCRSFPDEPLMDFMIRLGWMS